MKITLLCLLTVCGLPLSSYAQNPPQSFRITAEFLYPNTTTRPVVTLPNLIVGVGTLSEAKYSSRDEVSHSKRDHTVSATLTAANEGLYKLDFKYDEWTTDTTTNHVGTFSSHTEPTLRPGVDVVAPVDILNPAKGVFRIKIEPVTP